MPADGEPRAHHPTIHEIVEALLLFDEPILNHRFRSLLARHPAQGMRKELEGLPEEVLEAERSAREGATAWKQHGGLGVADARFRALADRALLESFLSLTESEIRLFSFLARNAPDHEGREPFDEAAERLREIAAALRNAASRSMANAGFPGEERSPLTAGEGQSVQVFERSEGLREHVEEAIRRSRSANNEPRLLVLSHTAYRHLRDQGCFTGRQSTVSDVPASIDFAWDGIAFAILTYQAATLDEIFSEADQPA